MKKLLPHKVSMVVTGKISLPPGAHPGGHEVVVYQRVKPGLGNLTINGSKCLQIRAHVPQVDRKSLAQSKARYRMARAIAAWQELSEEHKGLWRARASHTRMSGYNLFIRSFMLDGTDEAQASSYIWFYEDLIMGLISDHKEHTAPLVGNELVLIETTAGLRGIQSTLFQEQGAALLAKLLTVDGASSGLDADTVDGLHATNFATTSQGSKADSAVQPGALGSAASHADSDFATAAQGAKADTAVQPGALGSAASHAATYFALSSQIPNILVTQYSQNGTWVKQSWTKLVVGFLVGGGGAGGSGRRGAAGSARSGGAGGSPGGVTWFIASASYFEGETWGAWIGAKGTGGAAITVDSTSGSNGGAGGVTEFSGPYTSALDSRGQYATKSWSAGGGNGGAGGGITAAAGGTATTRCKFPSVAGGASSITGDSPGAAQPNSGPGPGGGGGCISTANTSYRGGWSNSGASTETGFSRSSYGWQNNDGEDGTNSLYGATSSTGGTGGGAYQSTKAGKGGNGGNPGGGGAGGGASLNGNNSGAGGDGGVGYVMIIEIG